MTNFFKYYLLLSLILISCSEETYKFEVLAYDQERDLYDFKIVEIITLDDIDRLSGTATSLYGGTSIILDYEKYQVKWERIGRPVAFGYTQKNGIHYPEDFDSLAMISIYYNIEQAMLFFEELGLEPGSLGKLETHYFAKVKETGLPYHDMFPPDEDGYLRDNAFFLAIDEKERGFYVLPFKNAQKIPFSMNLGIMTHEYFHAVFQNLVYDNIPGGEFGIDDTETYNYLYGLNEGLADAFAWALSGDPSFMAKSLDSSFDTRDARDTILYTHYFDSAASRQFNYFNPYEIGSFLSALLYSISMALEGLESNNPQIPNKINRYQVAHAALCGIKQITIKESSYFHVTDFINFFLSCFDKKHLPTICPVVNNRYAIHYENINECQ